MRRSDTKAAADRRGARVPRSPRARRFATTAPDERWALWHLGAHGPITARALAGRLGVDPARVERLFEALGRRGYVREDPQGVPTLTSSGRRAIVRRLRLRRPPARREGTACA